LSLRRLARRHIRRGPRGQTLNTTGLVHEAYLKLAGLQAHDERLAKIFECRYFAGLSEEETAEALETSLRTVQRGWMKARAWLRDALESGAAEQ
jgi:DNA-directed RNA polymerase specialized sigma24 family protein